MEEETMEEVTDVVVAEGEGGGGRMEEVDEAMEEEAVDEAMEEETAMVVEAAEAKTANPSQSSLAPQSTNSSAQAFQSKAVVPFLVRSVPPPQSNSAAQSQNKAADQFPKGFPVNNAPTSQDSNAVQCQNRAVGP